VKTSLSLGYVARHSFIPFHARAERWAVIVAHRRAGKTVACVMDLIDSALRCKLERPRFAYLAPLYRQAKQVSWDYLKAYGLRVPGAVASESELKLEFPNGGQVRLYGADNPDSLRGLYLDGAILDEAADMSPRVYSEILRPALADRKGWCVWIGTPRGQNDFYDLIYGVRDGFKGAINSPGEWFYQSLKASESIKYYQQHPEERDLATLDAEELDLAKRQMTPEQYEQEFECSFTAAILGSYYGREMRAAEEEGRVGRNIYDPALSVCTAWDLGKSDATAIWFYQQSGFEIRIVDYYAASGRGLDHYVSVLQERAAGSKDSRGYKYARHYLPHDVQVQALGMDKTRLATLYSLGLQNVIVVPKLSVDDGINAVRKILPRCWFERDACVDGIKALRQYRREWDDTRKVFYEKPYHDWASDPADAFRYLAIGLQEPVAEFAGSRAPKRDLRWIY